MPAKKAAKQAAAKHADSKQHERKDLRRAYEHLGRVEALQSSVTGEFSKNVHTLVALAEKELGSGHRKDAAELLRAAEHLSFAALASKGARSSSKVSAELKEEVIEEVEHLSHRADERWGDDDSQHDRSVAEMFRQSLEAAGQALEAGSLREALELSRGAEALAHIKKHGPDQLGSGAEDRRLARP